MSGSFALNAYRDRGDRGASSSFRYWTRRARPVVFDMVSRAGWCADGRRCGASGHGRYSQSLIYTSACTALIYKRRKSRKANRGANAQFTVNSCRCHTRFLPVFVLTTTLNQSPHDGLTAALVAGADSSAKSIVEFMVTR